MAIIDAMDGVTHVTEVNAGALIAWAVGALPSTGGIVDARKISPAATPAVLLKIKQTILIDKPVTLWLGAASLTCEGTANPAFDVRNSLRVVGLNRQSTGITSLTDGTLFSIPAAFAAELEGQDELSLESMELAGLGESSAMLVVAGSAFKDGLIRIENCNIHSFGGVAIQLGEMNRYLKLRNNYFIRNRGSVFLDRQADAVIEANEFYSRVEAAPNPPPPAPPVHKPQVEVVGPNVRIVGNVFIRATHSVSSEPDIQIRPKSSNRDGGFVWIVDNRITPEGENMDPERCRIRVRNPDAGGNLIVSPPAIVRGNLIGAVGSAEIEKIVRADNTVTVTLRALKGHPRLPQNAQVAIAIDMPPSSPLKDTSFNGVFAVTASNEYTFTYPQVGDNKTIEFPAGSPAFVTPLATTAIRLDNPVEGWNISENIFFGFGTIVDDSAQPSPPVYPFGLSTFKDNAIAPPRGLSAREFSAGGKQFSSVHVPVGSALEPWSEAPRDGETLKLQNYLRSSEDLSLGDTFWPHTNVGVRTPGQADPFGTTRAFRLVRSGALASERIYQDILLPSGWTLGSQLVVKFWAKAGTMAGAPPIVAAGIFDRNVGRFAGGLHTFSLGDTWKQYKFVARGIDATHLYRLSFYPLGIDAVAGDMYLFAPQVSEIDCDYLPTTRVSPLPPISSPPPAHAVEDAEAGNRFQRDVILTRVKTAARAPGSAPALSNDTGLGSDPARAATLEEGSTDMAGVIQLKAGKIEPGFDPPGSSGSVQVTFSAPYATYTRPLFARAPVVLASLVDGESAWSAAAQVKVLSDVSASGFTLRWDNGAALTPSGAGDESTYKISYVVIGR